MKNHSIISLVVLLFAAAIPVALGADKAASCPVTRSVQANAPREAGVSPLSGTWHINADRSIWALTQVWRAGITNKEPWFRPANVQLVVTGHRLDGTAPALKVTVAGIYATRFQATGMEFPVAGCWEVTGKAGDKELHFITKVEPSHVP